MPFKKDKQMSETFLIGALLAVTGGFLDAYSYLLRGHVFANAQTGNIVLLGVNLAGGKFTQVLYYFIPIVAFAAGILVSELIRRTFREHTNIHWRQITVGAEFIILLIVAFIPRGTFDVIANVAISFICSLQVQSFRKVNGNAYATTMCTGNLRSATEKLFQYHITKDKQERNKSLQYYGIILFFILGAGIGAWCSHFFAEKSVLFCCALLLSAFLVMFIQPLSPENPENSSI